MSNGHIDIDTEINKISEINKIINEINEEININLLKDQVFMMGDKPSRTTPEPMIKYTGKFLVRKNNLLKLGVCVGRKRKLEYEEEDVVDISYIESKSLYSFNARILKIRKAVASDKFKIDEMMAELGDADGYIRYVFEVIPMTAPEKHQRREFFRMSLGIDIYYKIAEADKAGQIADNDLKFENGKAEVMKKNAENGFLEKDGYARLTTMDMSAGGFKCKSETKIEAGTYLDCLIIVEDDVLPAIVQILSSNAYEDDSDLYDIRALFYKISDPSRDRLLKYIFYKQRQIQSEFLRDNL